MVYKQPKWRESCTSKQAHGPKDRKLNDLQKHTATNAIVDQIEKAILAGIDQVLLVRLTSKAKTNMKNTVQWEILGIANFHIFGCKAF